MQVKYIYAEKVFISFNFTALQTIANKLRLYRCRPRVRGGAAGSACPEQEGGSAPGGRAVGAGLLGDSGEGGDGQINSLKNQFALPTD